MKSLFRMIDGRLKTAKTLVTVSVIFCVFVLTAVCICAFVYGGMIVGGIVTIAVIVVGGISILVFLVFWNLVVSYLEDVKLIRNKLYNVGVGDIASEYGMSVSSTQSVTYVTNGNYTNYL